MHFSAETEHFCRLLSESYKKFHGQPILESSTDNLAESLYHANFVLVAHLISDDPIFCFANLQAQKLWEMDWEEFTQTPSRKSAPEAERKERQGRLNSALESNSVTIKDAIRVTKSGKQFLIKEILLWNVLDEKNNLVGQAAIYDGSTVKFL